MHSPAELAQVIAHRRMDVDGLSCLGCHRQLVIGNGHVEIGRRAAAQDRWKTHLADRSHGWPVHLIVPVDDCLVPAEGGRGAPLQAGGGTY